ncbi:PhzF family phenazine biosynthesis protein [Candidatus Poribacteria bacterium]
MGPQIFQVDAFTDKPFSGNPAAVCILSESRDDGWMQRVAQEMNLSETAFLRQQDDGFSLRWFTPTMEVPLCGHATLASAHTLWESGLLMPSEQAQFYTRSGLLTAVHSADRIEMNFPVIPEESSEAPPDLAEALGVNPRYVGKNELGYLLEVDSEDTVRNLTPDFNLLKEVKTLGVMVTSLTDSSEYDFVSRFFAPAAGIDEDPVTGSAHCCLGPFWSSRLGKSEFIAYQASARGGVVRVRLADERVYLEGNAVTVLRGELVDHGTAKS